MSSIKTLPAAAVATAEDSEAAAIAQKVLDVHARNHARGESARVKMALLGAAALQRDMPALEGQTQLAADAVSGVMLRLSAALAKKAGRPHEAMLDELAQAPGAAEALGQFTAAGMRAAETQRKREQLEAEIGVKREGKTKEVAPISAPPPPGPAAKRAAESKHERQREKDLRNAIERK